MVKNDATITLFYVSFAGTLHCESRYLETEFFENYWIQIRIKWMQMHSFLRVFLKRKLGTHVQWRNSQTCNLVISFRHIFALRICTVHGMEESFLYVPIFLLYVLLFRTECKYLKPFCGLKQNIFSKISCNKVLYWPL